MNVSFTNQQRHALARILLIAAGAIGVATLAVATNPLSSGFTLRAETLIALVQGVLGA